jgi:uncharacterized protein YoxC
MFRLLVALVVAASLGVFATGCGSSGDSSTTTTAASATETWASGVCSSITTWQSAVTSAVSSVKGDPTKAGLQTAADDAKSATQTLASDLKGLGKPDTQDGQKAKDSLDQLSTNLQTDVDTIQSAVEGVSGVSGVLTAVSTVTGTLATMGTQVKTTFTDLQGLDAKGELKDAFASASSCDSLTNSGS